MAQATVDDIMKSPRIPGFSERVPAGCPGRDLAPSHASVVLQGIREELREKAEESKHRGAFVSRLDSSMAETTVLFFRRQIK